MVEPTVTTSVLALLGFGVGSGVGVLVVTESVGIGPYFATMEDSNSSSF